MSWQLLTEHTAPSPGTTVVAAHDGHGHARLDVTTDGYGRGWTEGGRLVCQAVHEVRLCSAHHVEFALNAAGPACGSILEALHADTGDVESIRLRRAGSSVMVSLELKPLATPDLAAPAPAAPPDRPGHRPTGALHEAVAAR